MNDSLEAMEKEISEIQKKLAKLGPMRPGTLGRQYRDRENKQGGYWQISYTHKRRSRTEHVKQEPRQSFDHDHVITDLAERFVLIFEFLSEQKKWRTAHVSEGKIILDSFDGVETGLRQLRRSRPLEIERFSLPDDKVIVVPTLEELLRVKAFLITNRNQTRDYIDVAAMAERFGTEWAAVVLRKIDDYYEKILSSSGSVAAELVVMLGAPEPKDESTTRSLKAYKGLDPRYHDWEVIKGICQQLSAAIIAQRGSHDLS